MKIRIKGNTLRLRLAQRELKLLATEGRVTESTAFGPDQVLQYALESSATASGLEVTYRGGEICVILPAVVAEAWIGSDQVSIEAMQDNATAVPLSILIEKDFRCLSERPGEDETDLFPHPQQGHLTC